MKRPTINLTAIRRALARAKPGLLELAVFAGLALAAYGVSLIYLPAGLIVGGLLLSAVAVMEIRA